MYAEGVDTILAEISNMTEVLDVELAAKLKVTQSCLHCMAMVVESDVSISYHSGDNERTHIFSTDVVGNELRLADEATGGLTRNQRAGLQVNRPLESTSPVSSLISERVSTCR
jgi:hypothetical protein